MCHIAAPCPTSDRTAYHETRTNTPSAGLKSATVLYENMVEAFRSVETLTLLIIALVDVETVLLFHVHHTHDDVKLSTLYIIKYLYAIIICFYCTLQTKNSNFSNLKIKFTNCVFFKFRQAVFENHQSPLKT